MKKNAYFQFPDLTSTVLILMLSFILCFNLVAATNKVWFCKVSSSHLGITNLTVLQICNIIEKESVKLDQRGYGVRIVYALSPFLLEVPARINFDGCQRISLLELLLMSVRVAGMECIVTDDVAIIGRRNYRCITVAFSGRCMDAKTGKSITSFEIDASPFSPVLTISTNGEYTCAIPCLIDFGMNDDVIFSMHSVDRLKQSFCVHAQGYKERNYYVPVFQPGVDFCQPLDIMLFPLKGASGSERLSGAIRVEPEN